MNATVALTPLHIIAPLLVIHEFGPFRLVNDEPVVVPPLLSDDDVDDDELVDDEDEPPQEFDLGNIRTLCTFPYLLK